MKKTMVMMAGCIITSVAFGMQEPFKEVENKMVRKIPVINGIDISEDGLELEIRGCKIGTLNTFINMQLPQLQAEQKAKLSKITVETSTVEAITISHLENSFENLAQLILTNNTIGVLRTKKKDKKLVIICENNQIKAEL